MWNANTRQLGPNPYSLNIRDPGGSNPVHLLPINPAFPSGPFPIPPRVSQGNPAFPPCGPPQPVPQPGYPGCEPSGSYPPPGCYSPPYPPSALGMPPVNPLASGMVELEMVMDKKMQKKMKKAHKKMHKHSEHGKHFSSSSSSNDSD